MAAPDRTSKKRSAANSGSTPPDIAHVFFIDRSLGQKIIAGRLRQSGVHVEIHDDHFPQNALDEDWLLEVGEREWIVLTKDDRLRYPASRVGSLPEKQRASFYLRQWRDEGSRDGRRVCQSATENIAFRS